MKRSQFRVLNGITDPNTGKQKVWEAIENIGRLCSMQEIFKYLVETHYPLDKRQLSGSIRQLKRGGRILKYPNIFDGGTSKVKGKYGLSSWFKDGVPIEEYL